MYQLQRTKFVNLLPIIRFFCYRFAFTNLVIKRDGNLAAVLLSCRSATLSKVGQKLDDPEIRVTDTVLLSFMVVVVTYPRIDVTYHCLITGYISSLILERSTTVRTTMACADICRLQSTQIRQSCSIILLKHVCLYFYKIQIVSTKLNVPTILDHFI